ncbi:hypothetical protein K504DRAFT_463174 [Pleomassaria siparia CBS 279.74]|uniref:Lysine-specific metallo-endopeptidase domain-containing protein n=1 Tax=Pleomassaria siparia CBS 279.74 TaxID=1314801 RepID=A0A6G1JT77_9PLEO|nr:hypothetical protein K504DRAFT_463174 [Pleomassaria siparia CBS 279.74]
MYTVRVVLLLLQSLALVEASVKWTLHSSCYRTKDGQGDDNDLATAMINAVSTSKAWAHTGSEKLKGSTIPFIGKTTKDAMKPLMSKGNYGDNVKVLAALFDKLDELEGPIGQNADAGGRYDASTAWTSLAQNDNHYLDFLIVCRPSLVDRRVVGSFTLLPYDVIRDNQLMNEKAGLKVMTEQEDDTAVGDWTNIQGNRLQAITSVDDDNERTGDRVYIPETITFHPLWLKYQRDQGFSGWTDQLFADVTDKRAVQVFKDKGKAKGNDNVVPMDALLDSSFVRNIFHEFFHLSAFGGMADDIGDAYGWVNNVNNQNYNNPDFLAIVATVIELLYRKGPKYKVSADGAVRKSS